MSTTTAAGPPAATGFDAIGSAATGSAAPPAAVSPGERSDPAVLLQGQRSAECELAEALARFQAEVMPAVEMSLPAVVEAARGAFRLGFAYTACRGLADDGQPLLEVTVLHRGGDQLSSQVRLAPGDAEQEFREAARLLAQLLGIPVRSMAQQAQHSKAEGSRTGDAGPAALAPPSPAAAAPPSQASPPLPTPPAAATTPLVQAAAGSPEAAPAPAGTPAVAPAVAPTAVADVSGPGSADAAGSEDSLRPLEAAERELLVEMIRSLRPVEARRQFQIAFRHHFNVPKEVRSIAGYITQQRHRDFIDRFERELADLPPASQAALTAAAPAPAEGA